MFLFQKKVVSCYWSFENSDLSNLSWVVLLSWLCIGGGCVCRCIVLSVGLSLIVCVAPDMRYFGHRCFSRLWGHLQMQNTTQAVYYWLLGQVWNNSLICNNKLGCKNLQGDRKSCSFQTNKNQIESQQSIMSKCDNLKYYFRLSLIRVTRIFVTKFTAPTYYLIR